MGKAKKKTGGVKKPTPPLRRPAGMVEPQSSEDAPTATRHAELIRLERKHFSRAGQAERVQRAQEALKGLRVDFNLDPETVRWIAQDVDIEDF